MNGYTIKKRILIVGTALCGLLAVSSLTGCADYGNHTAGKSVYSAQFPQSPLEYSGFLNKEITTVTNELSTQIMLAQSVTGGTYPIQDAITSAQNSLTQIKDCEANVDTMQPSTGYEEDRTRTLELIQNAESSVNAYIETLTEGANTKKIASCRDVMQADYIAMTAVFNNYRK